MQIVLHLIFGGGEHLESKISLGRRGREGKHIIQRAIENFVSGSVAEKRLSRRRMSR